MSEENRAAIAACAEAAAKEGLAKSRELTDFYLDGLKEGGMTVSPPSDTLSSELKGFGDTMTAEWIEAAGEPGKQLVEAYRAGN